MLVCEGYADGELVASKEYNEYTQGGWMNATIGEVYIGDTTRCYRVEISAKDSNPKCDLQLLGLAYTTED